MRLSEFDYDLPIDLIAQEPLQDRAASRLLRLHRESGVIEHKMFRDVLDILKKGDLLILNDTRVSARRLLGQRKSGANVEALLMRRDGCFFDALMRPAKKLKVGEDIEFQGDLVARVVEELGNGQKRLHFQDEKDLNERLYEASVIPLPPYIQHALVDEDRYQTVFSATDGSAAAPTAGLHFTNEMLDKLTELGVQIAFVTLDVGIDTFRPVSVESIEDHVIHGERCHVPEATVKAVAECPGRIIAVGTTSVRTLESMAIGKRKINSGAVTTRLFITPGYEFKIVDGMFTNFHLPKTSMLFMVAALFGRERLMRAYEEAIAERYRFLSFGDSMLVL